MCCAFTAPMPPRWSLSRAHLIEERNAKLIDWLDEIHRRLSEEASPQYAKGGGTWT
jgi:hypothetical protein